MSAGIPIASTKSNPRANSRIIGLFLLKYTTPKSTAGAIPAVFSLSN